MFFLHIQHLRNEIGALYLIIACTICLFPGRTTNLLRSGLGNFHLITRGFILQSARCLYPVKLHVTFLRSHVSARLLSHGINFHKIYNYSYSPKKLIKE